MARVILFDIDNTLLYSGGAGGYAMRLAFADMFGVTDGFAGIEFSGRTDRFILQEGLAAAGIEGGPETHLDEFTRRYNELLPKSMAEREGYLMPGFPELLAELASAGARLGLATGNFSEAARIKLTHFGIADYFQGGGFGEESIDRAHVVAAAIRAVASGSSPSDIFVVGDTPHDVSSGLENDAVAIGVATGKYTTEELSDAGAHLVFQDFADWQSASQQLLG